ncbi:4'-phosphopantetheinyl transferase [Dactylosporangium sp. NPDC051541]|uniref:4'-phosphopantetheinyl transferase n=1 Tax=Dactylosporangium sp. NPDC051541 TaxID=3363977 RepID=UPI0037AFEB9E
MIGPVRSAQPLLDRLVPATVAAVEAYDDEGAAALYPEEAAAVARAVERRRREFGTVRHCARRALDRLGRPPAPILPGERGAPTWPAGVVGSMTHCAGYRAAALAHRRDVRAIGIDAEPDDPLPVGVLDAIGRPEERAMVHRLAGSGGPGPCWDRLLFSAKESVYKAWFPLARTFLDFDGARIAIDPAGTFTAGILAPGPVTELTGRWQAARGLVLTAIVVPAGEP